MAGFLGRLHAQKGLDVLLAAMPLALKNLPTLKLVIAGDGPERGRLATQSLSLGLSDRVIFTGELDRPEEALAACDCLALPSRWEGMPNAVLEAMAAGLPVVASAVGAVPELVVTGKVDQNVPGETGLVVPPGDSGALAAALVAALQDPERAAAMGRAGKERVARRYGLSRMIAEYELLYTELSGNV